MAGILYVLATPIGNLGDLSPRAAETLRRVAVVAAEDTRQTLKLRDHVGSSARMLSWHAHSTPRRIEEIVALLAAGSDVALATDAGTPGVSDPGPVLVRAVLEAGFAVVPIPGPSAVATALMASGLPADRYVFLGFAPRKGAERDLWLARIQNSEFTAVCFEAPPRLGELLADLVAACGPDRQAFVGREMTKRFEEYRAGTLGELRDRFEVAEVRGEVTVVISGAARVEPVADPGPARAVARSLVQSGIERSRVAKAVADAFGLSRNESYRVAMEE